MIMKPFYLLITVFISVSTFAQSTEDIADGRFHDDLLNHLVGKWTVSGIVHGAPFQNLHLEAKWIMNHQYLQIHEQGTDTVPWLKMPWEATFLIGYNHTNKRYIFYEFTIRGVDEPYEGFSYGSRSGNELKIASKVNPKEIINQRFIWEPASGSWHIETRLEKAGKEGAPYLDLKAIPVQ
jgi:hypothetical protein